MMPVIHARADVSHDSNPDPATSIAVAGRPRQGSEILEENRHLAAENLRLSEENRALREAAGLWIRLYEKQLERANQGMSVCATLEGFHEPGAARAASPDHAPLPPSVSYEIV
jgi:hypothetical protein